jgi:hypothetical protein
LELDVIITEPPEPGTDAINSEDFRILGKMMEAANGDTARMHILKQACRAYHFDISQVSVGSTSPVVLSVGSSMVLSVGSTSPVVLGSGFGNPRDGCRGRRVQGLGFRV